MKPTAKFNCFTSSLKSVVWGGSRLLVCGGPFDAMVEVHNDRAVRAAEVLLKGPLHVLKVGFWNPNKPDELDPNDVITDFSPTLYKQ